MNIVILIDYVTADYKAMLAINNTLSVVSCMRTLSAVNLNAIRIGRILRVTVLFINRLKDFLDLRLEIYLTFEFFAEFYQRAAIFLTAISRFTFEEGRQVPLAGVSMVYQPRILDPAVISIST